MIDGIMAVGSLMLIAGIFVHQQLLSAGMVVIGIFSVVLAYFLRRQRYRAYMNNPANAPKRAAVEDRLRVMLREGNNLGAIKAFRQESGCSLKDAKDYVASLK